MWYNTTLARCYKPTAYFLLYCLLLLPCACLAQLHYVRQLTVNDGLPQGQVRAIVQDKRGFMWIATEGLSRYDGRSFLNFNHDFGDTSTIAGSGIFNLEIDDTDHLWLIFDSKQVDVMNTANSSIRHISSEPAFRWLQQLTGKNRITIRQTAGQYFAANTNSLVSFDIKTGSHQAIIIPKGEIVTALGSNLTGKVLVATTLALYEVRGTILWKIIPLPPLPDVVLKNINYNNPTLRTNLGKVVQYAGHNLAITSMGGVTVYNQQTGTCHYYQGKDPISFTYSPVQATDSNVYYISSEGINKLTSDEPPQLVYKNVPGKEVINHLLADHSGMLWAGTTVYGLRLFSLDPESFHSTASHESFASEVMGKWMPRFTSGIKFNSYHLRQAKDNSGIIWVLNRAYSFVNVSKPTFVSEDFYRFSRYGIDKIPFTDTSTQSSVYSFTIDNHNQFWLLYYVYPTQKMMLVKAGLLQHSVQHFAIVPGNFTANCYLTAIADKIAVLNENELQLYDTKTASYTVYPLTKLGVGSMLLMAVPDRQQHNILWIATKGSGIVKLNIATGATQHYTEAEGLPNNVVYYIAPDKKGFFWCSSNKGLFRFNPADGGVITFTVKDGLQGNEFNRYHFLETPDGHFYFGGTEGYTFFHPDSVFLDHYQTPVELTGLQVNNIPLQKLSPHWKDSLSSNLSSITLPYYQNQLSFSFAGLQYSAPEKLEYRYRLIGISDGWVNAGDDAGASYAAIPPGHYVLEINASNTSGQWSNATRKLSITILPPWWRTWWMYCLCTAALLTIVWLFLRNRLRRLQLSQQVLLKQQEAEQAHALEETKSRFFANITHELRTPLTLILSPVQQQLKEGAGTYSPLLKGVYHNSQTLLRLINQLLDMSKLEAGRMPLSLHRGNVPAFIESLLTPFRQQAATRRIRFISQVNDNWEEENLFDSNKLEKVLYNLLSNAFKFTPEGGQISCQLSVIQWSETQHTSVYSPWLKPGDAERKDIFQVQVSDTGVGISQEHLPHIFNRFYQVNTSTTRKYEGTGIGLSLVKEFVDLMDGTIAVESTPGNGTAFTLTLPLAVAKGNEAEVIAAEQEIFLSIADIENHADKESFNEAKPLVLVTEDNEQLRRFIKTSLQPHYRVLTADNGETGLQTTTIELPELIISDVMMPMMDGYDFCQKVKENSLTSHIGFILLTAKTADESRLDGLRLKADYYIGKPFMVEELLLVASNLLKRQQQLRELYSKQLQQPAEKLPPINKIEDTFLQSIYTIIEKNLNSDNLDVAYLASELAISPRTLNRKLTAVANTSANELIRNYRLKKAATLLLEGFSVNNTAYATGFSTPSYFIQCFKEMYGATPLQYGENGSMSQN